MGSCGGLPLDITELLASIMISGWGWPLVLKFCDHSQGQNRVMTYSFISGGTAPLMVESLPVLSCGSSGRTLGTLVLIDWVEGFAFLDLDPNLHVKLVFTMLSPPSPILSF